MTIGCHLPSGEVFGGLLREAFQRRLPWGERGFRNPGLFDKWRWRKRNVDGGVLASLDYLKTWVLGPEFEVLRLDERLRRYTFT